MTKFFKARKTTTTIQPKIEVSYLLWAYDENLKLQMKKQWESLLKELESDPSIIKSREWQDYSHDGTRRERLVVEIDGVTINLEGPYYPDPNWKNPTPQPPKTETERGNEAIDSLLGNRDVIWPITHCSERKFEALIEFLKATRSPRSTQ